MLKTNLNTRGKVLVIALILIAIFAIIFLITKYMPSFEHWDYDTYYGLPSDEVTFLVDDEYLYDTHPYIDDGNMFLPFDFVQTYVDPYIFWDENTQKLTITTSEDVLRFQADETTAFLNGSEETIDLPVIVIDGLPYVPIALVENLYNIKYDYNTDTNLFIYNSDLYDYTSYEPIEDKEVTVRTEPNIKSPILSETTDTLISFDKTEELNSEDITLEDIEEAVENSTDEIDETDDVESMEEVNLEETGFIEVRTIDGIIGYAKEKNITQSEVVIADNSDDDEAYFTDPITTDISLAWEQIYNIYANYNDNKRSTNVGMNVISPTWFSLDEDKLDGSLVTVGDPSYVDWAHDNDYQVWAVVTENQSYDRTHEILSDTDKRERLIVGIMSYISIYNLDGINIDFEALNYEDGDLFTQFLRELYPYMKKENKILSVDLFVPKPWTAHYDKEEIGKTVDYICVMTYDEHTSVSETSGPVASLDFVDEGIADTLEDVPKEKILMGLPFYCRVWREEYVDGEYTKSLSNYSMERTKDTFDENGAEWVWDSDTGYYYGEYTVEEDGNEVTYKTWLEDAASINAKMQIFEKYDIKGVAAWSRGFETPDVWETIDSYVDLED